MHDQSQTDTPPWEWNGNGISALTKACSALQLHYSTSKGCNFTSKALHMHQHHAHADACEPWRPTRPQVKRSAALPLHSAARLASWCSPSGGGLPNYTIDPSDCRLAIAPVFVQYSLRAARLIDSSPLLAGHCRRSETGRGKLPDLCWIEIHVTRPPRGKIDGAVPIKSRIRGLLLSERKKRTFPRKNSGSLLASELAHVPYHCSIR